MSSKVISMFFFPFHSKVFLQNDSDSKTEHQKKKKNKFHDSQVIPYSGNILSSSENSKNIKAN